MEMKGVMTQLAIFPIFKCYPTKKLITFPDKHISMMLFGFATSAKMATVYQMTKKNASLVQNLVLIATTQKIIPA